MPENETARDPIRGVLVFSCRWQSRTPNTSQRPFASAQGEAEDSPDLSKRTSAFCTCFPLVPRNYSRVPPFHYGSSAEHDISEPHERGENGKGIRVEIKTIIAGARSKDSG